MTARVKLLLVAGVLCLLGAGAAVDSHLRKARSERLAESIEGAAPWQGSYDDAMELARRDHKAVFVFVTTRWCGYCKAMDKAGILFTPEALAALSPYVPLRIDGDDDRALADSLGVRGYPCGLFVVPDAGQYPPFPAFADTGAGFANIVRRHGPG